MVNVRHLKKGDVLMKEGETSNSMYWVQSGTLRLYKKKGPGFIELGVVHSGEVVGEMSFLDNQARSASVEALQPCDIVEIPRGKFDEFIGSQPSWMKSLVHTLVKRLRTTNNRVRELESASTVYSRDEDGRTTKVHEFLSTLEQLRLSSACLLAAARNSERNADGSLRMKAGWLQYYGSQIFNIQLAKVQAFTDVLHENEIVRIEKKPEGVELHLLNLDRLEKFIYFAQEENAKPDEQQLPITKKGMEILDAVARFGGILQAPASGEKFSVNLDEVFAKAAAAKGVKVPFDYGAWPELLTAGFAQDLKVEAAAKVAEFSLLRFQKLYPVMALRQRFRELNAQKREG